MIDEVRNTGLAPISEEQEVLELLGYIPTQGRLKYVRQLLLDLEIFVAKEEFP
jgi:hypothetical protein